MWRMLLSDRVGIENNNDVPSVNVSGSEPVLIQDIQQYKGLLQQNLFPSDKKAMLHDLGPATANSDGKFLFRPNFTMYVAAVKTINYNFMTRQLDVCRLRPVTVGYMSTTARCGYCFNNSEPRAKCTKYSRTSYAMKMFTVVGKYYIQPTTEFNSVQKVKIYISSPLSLVLCFSTFDSV